MCGLMVSSSSLLIICKSTFLIAWQEFYFKSNSPFKSQLSVNILPRYLSSKNIRVVQSMYVVFC